jgi:hypothetical protein
MSVRVSAARGVAQVELTASRSRNYVLPICAAISQIGYIITASGSGVLLK